MNFCLTPCSINFFISSTWGSNVNLPVGLPKITPFSFLTRKAALVLAEISSLSICEARDKANTNVCDCMESSILRDPFAQ